MKYTQKINRSWLWTHPNQIAYETTSIPEPGSEDVLVHVRAVGVCGTDLGILNGKNPNAKPPLPLGHEIAAQVVTCGEKVTMLKPGDRVFLDPYIGCGHCEACRAGNKTYCTGGGRHLGIHIPGGWQEYLALPERNCYIIPENLGYLEASQAETIYTVMSGIMRLTVKIGSSALVIGDGPTGVLFARLLQLAGCTHVTMAGHHLERLELAKKWGTNQTVYTKATSLESALDTSLFDVTVDTVGSQTAIDQVVKYAAPGGQVILFGIPSEGKPLAVDVMTVVMRGVGLLGATDNPFAWPAVTNILSSGVLQVKDMFTAVFPFDRLPEAVEAARSKNTVKIIISNE